jgi:hypothetical protein
MSLPNELAQMLTLARQLSHWQQLGLAFLLGSFAVATWSDLKYLAAQREFLEVWLLFLFAVLIHDAVAVRAGTLPMAPTVGKWLLLAVFSVLSLRRVGVLFRLAVGDVAALAAAASLLSPILLVCFYVIARGLAMVLGPILARGAPVYPFMPIVTLATLAVLALGLLMS